MKTVLTMPLVNSTRGKWMS